MPDLMLAIEYLDGDFREGSVTHWLSGFPKKQIRRLWLRPLLGPGQVEISGHSLFAIIPGAPLEVFNLDLDGDQLRGDRWKIHADRPPEVDVIDFPSDSPSLPPPSAFIPMIEVKRTSAVDRAQPAWLGNWDWVLRRWRARRR